MPAWEYRSIPIDFEVYKALTAKLQSPDDSYNNVLRRDLGMTTADGRATSSAGTRPWVVDGVTLPHGTEFRREFKGKLYTARVENGALVLDGKRHASPSRAAMAVTKSQTNGWVFWECREPGEADWIRLDSLRDPRR